MIKEMIALIFSSVNFTRMKAKVEMLIKLYQTILKLRKFKNTNFNRNVY